MYERSIDATRVRARYMPVMDLLPNLGLLAVLAYGGHLVLDGELTVGQLVAFNAYVGLLIWPLRMTGQIVAQGQRAAAAAGRVAEVLGTDPQIVDHPQPRRLPTAHARAGALGEVRFESVSFGYAAGGGSVLDDLDLVVEPGASVALVGATGSGKTTVARLIPRFYDVDSGRVCIDGVDVRDLRVHDLRRAVGIVFEDTFLFNDTVRANIAFADPDAPDAAVERAARLAGAHEFVTDLPDGYESLIGERGFSLSGGQRQRIAIRASNPRRSPRAHPRRRHECGRPHEGARDPRRARGSDAGPDHDRHRAPSGHRGARRSGGPARSGTGRRRGNS